MRRPVVLLVLCAATVAAAGSRAPLVILAPPLATDDLDTMALTELIEARAHQLLDATATVTVVHPHAVLAATQREALTDLERLRLVLGADRIVRPTMKPGQLDWVLHEQGRKPVTGSIKLKPGLRDAVERAALELARVLLKRAPTAVASLPPATDDAMRALATCQHSVSSLPLPIAEPTPFDDDALDAAQASCLQASVLEPKLPFAAPNLALAQLFAGRDAEAAKTVATLNSSDDGSEMTTFVRWWLATQNGTESGLVVARAAIARHPRQLTTRLWLAQALLALNDDGAEKAWRDVLNLAPNQSSAHLGLSRALPAPSALVEARKAFELAPFSADARVNLASHLDPHQAFELLAPLASSPTARGAHLLQLGQLAITVDKPEFAVAQFQHALDVAVTVGDFRTRGAAFYELARVEAMRGRLDAARVALRASRHTGAPRTTIAPVLADVWRELEHAETLIDAGAPTAGLPRERSLIAADSAVPAATTASRRSSGH